MLQKTSNPAPKKLKGPSLLRKIAHALSLKPPFKAAGAGNQGVSKVTQAQQMEQIYSALYGVVHEIRAPLAGLKLVCNQLAEDPGNQELVLTLSKRFPQHVDNLLRLTTSVLKYCKEFLVPLELHLETTDLVKFLEDLVAEFEASSSSTILKYQIECEQDSVFALIDREQIKTALVNILQNSVEACSDRIRGSVILQIVAPSVQDTYVNMSVVDNGPGISEEVRATLFDPFVSYGKEGNVGLGLTFSKRIIEAHGGILQTVNNQKPGAKFSIRLPK